MATRSRPSSGALLCGIVFVAGGFASFAVAIGRSDLGDAPSLGLIVAGATTLIAFAIAGLLSRDQRRNQGGEVRGVGTEPGPLSALDSND